MKKLLSNSYLCHSIGIIFVLVVLQLYVAPINGRETVINSMWMVGICYLATAMTLPRITSYLLVERKFYILPVLLSVFGIAITIMFMVRIEYSRSIVFYGWLLSFVWLFFTALIRQESQRLVLFAIPNFDVNSLNKKGRVRVIELKKPYDIRNIKGSKE